MQLSLFEYPQVKVDKPIRLIELFGGIGSQAMALRDIGADFEHYRLVEFDKYAVASYNSIHGTDFVTADIRNVHGKDLGIVDKDKFTYLLTYSFPCTDLSVAGNMKGMSKAEWEKGNSTRSGLLWEVERILKELPKDLLPQVLLMENVPQVHAEQNKADFDAWLAFLRSRGYFNFYKDLNAKDYGIPQNRERCFCVSILSPEYIDYEFPEPRKLGKVMREYLEDKVDEKYFLTTDKSRILIQQLLKTENINQNIIPVDLSLNFPRKLKIANCITAREDRSVSNLQHVGNGVLISTQLNYRRVEKINNTIVKTIEARDYKGFNTGYSTQDGAIRCEIGGCFDSSYPDSKIRRGRVQNDGDITPTLTASSSEAILHIESIQGASFEKRISEILYILQSKIGKESFSEWAARGLYCFLQKEILQQRLYAKELLKSWAESADMEQFTYDSEGNQSTVTNKNQLRNMWEKWAVRCSSYRQQLSEQQYREFESFV